MESPQEQESRAAASSSNAADTGAMLTDRRMCESPRQSMSEGGHSDFSTLAEKDEVNDVGGHGRAFKNFTPTTYTHSYIQTSTTRLLDVQPIVTYRDLL